MCCEIWDKSAKTLPGLRHVGVLDCAFAELCKKITLKMICYGLVLKLRHK